MPNKIWKRNPRFKRRIEEVVKAIPKAAERATHDALRTNGDEGVRVVRAAAPVGDTGKIRGSVGWSFGDPNVAGTKPKNKRKSNTPDHLRISIYAGGAAAPHAAPVHFGTKDRETKSGASRGKISQPQPFFYPFLYSRRKRFKQRVSRQSNKAVRDSVA